MSLRKAVGHTVILERNELGLAFGSWSCLPSMCEALGFTGWVRRWRAEREVKEEAEEELLKQGDPSPFFYLIAYLFLAS